VNYEKSFLASASKMCDSHKITYHFYSIALIPSIEVLLGLQKLQYKDPQEQLTMVIM